MSALNQASFLSDSDPAGPLQDCLEVTDLIQPIRLVMIDFLLTPNGIVHRWEQLIQDRIRYAGTEGVTQDITMWAQSLSKQTSTQRAELLALTQTLYWGKAKAVTINTGSPYAFVTALVMGSCRRKGDCFLVTHNGDSSEARGNRP